MRLDAERERFISRVEKIRLEWVNVRPVSLVKLSQSEVWTVTEVVEHLVLVESGIAQFISKALAETGIPANWFGAPGREGRLLPLLSFLRGRILASAMKRPIKVKSPSDKVMPRGIRTLPDLIEEWRGVGERVRSTPVLGNQRKLRRLGVFVHPLIGMLNLQDTLKFIREHIFHHGFQLDRIERAFGD